MTKDRPHAFDADRQALYDRARAKLDMQRLADLLFDITDIHSPTGATRDLGEFMEHRLRDIGLDNGRYLPISEISGNVMGSRRWDDEGPSMLLYAPMDTHLEGDDSDYPWAAPKPTIDLAPGAARNGNWIYGLGSSNPKAMVAGLTEVMTALLEAGLPLKGEIQLAFGDGGMPVIIPWRNNAGLSHGVEHLVNRGIAPDFCVLMKPVNEVIYEEPGMAWFKVTVRGTLGYAGVRRGTPGFRSGIVPAAELLLLIEKWLPEYTAANTSGQIGPEGWIGALRSGWPERPSFPSAATEIFIDMRINPRVSPGEVKAQFAAFMADAKRRLPDLDADWEMYCSVPGGATSRDHWVIQSATRAWEHVEDRPYPDDFIFAGQTDGSALRRLGIPTVRIGWPWPAQGSPEPIAEGLGGMGATYVPDLMPCLEKILYIVIDSCTRPRSELLSGI